jgi:hypothetical protein
MADRYPNILGVVEEVAEGFTLTIFLRASPGIDGAILLADQSVDSISEARGVVSMIAKECCPEFVDRCAAGFREPAVCAIATDVSTRASSAIVVINFRMLSFQSGSPHDNGNGKLDHKVWQALTFCSDPSARGRCRRKPWGSASAISAKAASRARRDGSRRRASLGLRVSVPFRQSVNVLDAPRAEITIARIGAVPIRTLVLTN